MSAGPSTTIGVVIPVLDDWDSLSQLFALFPEQHVTGGSYHFIIADDGSLTPMPEQLPFPAGSEISVVHIGASLGHQRAICVGLKAASQIPGIDTVIVMDGDGEDSPLSIPTLLESHRSSTAEVVVAQRASRSENLRFRVFYRMYKWLFRILTGRRLDFGNFSVLSGGAVQRLLFMPETWNHYPGAIMRSGIDFKRVPVPRSSRIAGTSKMNFVGLLNHGVAGISVFIDQVLARLLLWAGAASLLLVGVVSAGVAIRLSAGVPMPGWFALVSAAAAIALVQIMATLLTIGFFSLSTRSRYAPPPAVFANDFRTDFGSKHGT